MFACVCVVICICVSLCGVSFVFLQDTPSGNWDGHYRGEKLCDIPSPLYGLLLPLNVVYAGTAIIRSDG